MRPIQSGWPDPSTSRIACFSRKVNGRTLEFVLRQLYLCTFKRPDAGVGTVDVPKPHCHQLRVASFKVDRVATCVGNHLPRVAGRPYGRRAILLTGTSVCESTGWTKTKVSFSRAL